MAKEMYWHITCRPKSMWMNILLGVEKSSTSPGGQKEKDGRKEEKSRWFAKSLLTA